MVKPSAVTYYMTSVLDLFLYTSWWKILQLFWKRPVTFTLPLKLQFQVWNLMDIWTLKELILDGHYERVQKIPPDACVIDIGASIGDFSIFAQKLRSASVVHSFEPDQNRRELFAKNQKLNGCQRGVLHPIALESLNDVFAHCKVNKCHFMKVDCEGAEYLIFSHASSQNLKKIQHIAFEVHFFSAAMKSEYRQLCQTLKKNGFRLIEKSNSVHDTIGFLYASQQNC